MDHLYIAFYLAALMSGAVILPALWLRFKNTKAFNETFAIYTVLTGLVFLGCCTLYISVNVATNPFIFTIFLTGVLVNIAFLLYLLPRQHYALFSLPFTPMHQYFYKGLAAIGLMSATLLWVAAFRMVAIVIPLILLIAVVSYCQWLYLYFYDSVYFSQRPKIMSLGLPLLGIGAGIIEGIWWADITVKRGVIISLPCVYLLHNICVWLFRNDIFLVPDLSPLPLPLEELTQKEREIAHAVARGLSNKQIAAELDITPSTVKNHLYNVFKKMGITNRFALIHRMQNPK